MRMKNEVLKVKKDPAGFNIKITRITDCLVYSLSGIMGVLILFILTLQTLQAFGHRELVEKIVQCLR
jgi:hypothetical protein